MGALASRRRNRELARGSHLGLAVWAKIRRLYAAAQFARAPVRSTCPHFLLALADGVMRSGVVQVVLRLRERLMTSVEEGASG